MYKYLAPQFGSILGAYNEDVFSAAAQSDNVNAWLINKQCCCGGSCIYCREWMLKIGSLK